MKATNNTRGDGGKIAEAVRQHQVASANGANVSSSYFRA
jgi:hypothetical protein